MKTPNPDHPIRNTLKHLALAVAVAGGLLAGTALAAPANDGFANAIALTGVAAGQTGDNISGTQTGTNNIAATLESGEPNPGATNTVWFKWTCPADGAFTYGTLGSRNGAATEWDAIIAIYTGAAVNDLSLIGGPKDTVLEESMTIPVTNGTTYFIQLAGYDGDTAVNLLLNWNFVPAAPPTIVSFTPPDGSTTLVMSDLVLTFTKPIAFDSGNITIKDLTTPANDRVIPVDPIDPQVSISGRVLTINPATDLVLGNSYAVQIDATAIMDKAGQPFAGILDDTTWNFTTVATATPTTTTVVSSGTPSTYGDSVTFTATVAPVPSGGTVQFQNDGSNLGAPVPVNTTTGKATVTTSLLGVAGLNKIYAEYSGNFQFSGSTSASILQGVTKAGLTVTAQNVGRYPNTANPDPFPYQISGFKNGQTLGTSGVTGTPALSTTAVLSSPVGPYPITPVVGTLAAANYDFTSFVDATLTVVDPASPIAINVNIDAVVQPVLVGPVGGLGEVWNTFNSPYGGGGMAALQTHYGEGTAASGPVTTVGVSTPYAPGNPDLTGGGLVWGTDENGNGPASLLMLRAGTANFQIAATNTQRFVITGLNLAKKYDLYVASANCIPSQKSRGVWYTNNTTSTPGNKACDNTAGIISDNWVLGNNYVLFEDVVPDGSGKITIDGYSTDGYRLPLNGFQLVEVTDPPPPAFRWKGANNGNWTDVANWNNTVPGAADIAILSDSDTAGQTLTLDADAAVAGLTFNNLVANQVIASPAGKTLTLATVPTLSANLTVEGTHSISAKVDISSGTKLGPGTVNLSGTVAAHQQAGSASNIAMFVSNGVLGISGTTTFDPGKRMRVDGSGTLEVTGVLNTAGPLFPVGSGDSTATATVILKGSGQWNQTHTTGGDVAIGISGANNGRLIIQDTAQLNTAFMVLGFFGPGAGTVQQNGGTVTLVTTPADYTALARPALWIGVSGPGDYHLNSGTLKCGTIGGSGKLYFNGGTLVANMDDLILVDPGASTAVGQTSFMQGLNQVVVQSGAVIDTAGHIITIAQNLEHDFSGPAIDGGLTKKGLGTLTLLQASCYTGPTKVQGGTLACATAASVAPTALEIDAAAKVDLTYTGNRNIPSLKIGVNVKDPGVYGSSSSPAPLANQDDVHFAGTGTVTVGGSTGFTSWAADNAPGQTPGKDHDNDGVENGVEYFMGQTGSSFTAMPGLDGTNKVTWTMDSCYFGTYEVQTSSDLVDWTNVDPRPLPSSGSLSYTLPADAPGGKSFVRLLVTPAP